MKSLLLTSLLVLLLASGQTFAASPIQSSPRDVATQFYRTYLKLKVSGLPDAEQYKAISPLLSPDLRRLFEAAQLEQARAFREHPNDKGPWSDGDLFTSLHEGAQSFRIGRPKIRGNYAYVPVHLEYRGGGSISRWEDTLILIRTAGGWHVWDILLKGDWQFKSGNNLRSILGSE